jgi:hypothetical protein
MMIDEMESRRVPGNDHDAQKRGSGVRDVGTGTYFSAAPRERVKLQTSRLTFGRESSSPVVTCQACSIAIAYLWYEGVPRHAHSSGTDLLPNVLAWCLQRRRVILNCRGLVESQLLHWLLLKLFGALQNSVQAETKEFKRPRSSGLSKAKSSSLSE